jgi:A/G-specific adenine glycosylase
MKKISKKIFSTPLLEWFDKHGRKQLPWQHPKDPYRIWVSEIMLQQTQVQTVIPYFIRFIEHFPTVFHLATASDDAVLALWSGLGYYSRARNLHSTSQLIVADYKGIFPQEFQALIKCPGIGQSTAAAILSQAFNLPHAILDGNVKRVLARFFMIQGIPTTSATQKIFWQYATACMSSESPADYTQAIMDLGALCCTLKNPLCAICPINANCKAYQQQAVALYPTKQIKKPVPLRAQQLLVLRNEQGFIYLEKRPPKGLWGGLWCLPSIDKASCPLEFISQEYALLGKPPQHITSFKHRFTHFHLDINAVAILVTSTESESPKLNGQWFSDKTLPTVGLARPTQMILSKIKEHADFQEF